MKEKNSNQSNFVNHLINEKSPYLKQHAHNPVNWYPWGEEAFEKAKREDKPILLSIGYSACHWCHVMAHESFENDSVASVMNDYFINIKVDREEYPDVDHLYQTFVQMTTGRGGWPLTVFLTPDCAPFYGGTYFPAEGRPGLVSFPELLRRIHEIYENDRNRIQQSTEEIKEFLRQANQIEAADDFPRAPDVFGNLYRSLKNSFDPEYGGFSKAPKFPQVADMEFLLRYYHHTGEPEAKNMVLLTLRKMALGGIFDQVGGGFHRYSTDQYWLVPHFEKMLYDNALLIPLYLDAYRLTRDDFFLKISSKTADFVLRELIDPAGGFYSTLDADSEGEEGKYYTWDYHELQNILDEDIRDIFSEYYGIALSGNFEGKNILHISRPLETLLPNYQLDKEFLNDKFKAALDKLFNTRQKRVRPYLDNKVKGQTENVSGYLDDYAYLIKALLDGFETVQAGEYLKMALKITDYSLKHFWDHENAGFYFAEQKGEHQIIRIRQNYNASTPSGNSLMCLNLQRLNEYTGMDRFKHTAEKMFQLHKSDMETRPNVFSSLLTAFLFYHFSPVEITLSVPDQMEKSDLALSIFRMFIPEKIFVRTDNLTGDSIINKDLITGREMKDRAAVFICYRNTCSLPGSGEEEVIKILKEFGLYPYASIKIKK
ncbi:MAG: thioredoxin domain-containing protein [Calditrichota bacterium]